MRWGETELKRKQGRGGSNVIPGLDRKLGENRLGRNLLEVVSQSRLAL